MSFRYRYPTRLPCYVLLVLAMIWTQCASAEEPLSLAAAQRAAVERSRQLASQDAAASAAKEMSVAARQLPDPMLQAGIDNLPVTGADQFSLTRDFMTMRRIGISQEFTGSAKREARAARFERESEKVLAERQESIAEIQRQTAAAWLDRYYAERLSAALQEQIGAAQSETKAVETVYRGGRGSQADVIASHAAVVELEDRRAEMGQRIARAKAALARWVGDLAQAPLAEAPSFDFAAMSSEELSHELSRHPNIMALKKQQEMAVAEANLARANQHADWTMELSYSVRGPAYSNMISFNVSIPLQWDQKNRQNRELAAKLALVNEAEAQQEEALRAHVAEVRAMLVDWETTRARIARYRKELLPLARERSRASLAAYSGGKAVASELIAARRAELEVELQAVQLESQAAQVWAQLNFLLPHASGLDGQAGAPQADDGRTRR